MAVSIYGQLAIQATAPGEDPVKVGSLWVDTSGVATLKVCTSVAPYTFTAITGGASAWGGITGTLADQTDLQAALDAKVASTRQVISGGGLTGGGDLSANRTLAVGAGTGITVNADDIAVNQAALKLDDWAAPDDNTDLNASTTAHGLAPKVTAPAAGLLSVLGVGNGETVRTEKPLFDTTSAAALGTAASGTQLVAARRDHVHALPKLDDLAAPDDNTDLDASASAHGLLKKLPGGTTTFLRGDGSFAVPASVQSGLEQAFRGLHVRTSPNADVAAHTVSVLMLDQWVADDGTVVDDTLANNTASIASSGAGGLDTGTEQASTWYEIYRIRKSSDGTLNLLLHRAKDYFQDEVQINSDASTAIRQAAGAGTQLKLAQGFDTDVTGNVEVSDIQLIKVGSPTGRIWFTLEADAAGAPSNTPLATSDKLDVSLISTSAQWIRVVFRSPVSLTAGTTYWLVAQGDWTQSGANYVAWRSQSGNPYAAGNNKRSDDGSTWGADTGVDQAFKIYVTENDAAVTMPSGYDQKCKVGYVYNNSGSNFNATVQHNRLVQLLHNDEPVNGATNTVASLVDLSASIPPVPVRVSFRVQQGSSGQAAAIGGVPGGYAITPNANGYRGRNGQAYMVSRAANMAEALNVVTEYQGLYSVCDGGTYYVDVDWWEWI